MHVKNPRSSDGSEAGGPEPGASLWSPLQRAVFRAQVRSDAPPEDMLGATAAGLRYVRHARALQAVLVRIGVFILGASHQGSSSIGAISCC